MAIRYVEMKSNPQKYKFLARYSKKDEIELRKNTDRTVMT